MFKEKIKSPEAEKKIETKIILEFMRHGKKEDDKTKANEDLMLTPEGKVQAVEKGKKLKPQPEVSLAWGSPRKRSQETAVHVMLANEDINPNASLEEMERAMAKEVKVGRKVIEDERLNFIEKGPLGKELKEAFNAGKCLPYIIKESDRRAFEAGDKKSSTYTRMAGNVAEIVERYVKIGNNFNRIASKSDKYEKFNNQLERYLGTHQGVTESFVAKILENIKGKEKKDEFVKAVGGGFKETEGVHLEIVNNGDEQKIIITYKVNDKMESIEVSKWSMEKIIEQREWFEKRIKTVKEKKQEAVEYFKKLIEQGLPDETISGYGKSIEKSFSYLLENSYDYNWEVIDAVLDLIKEHRPALGAKLEKRIENIW